MNSIKILNRSEIETLLTMDEIICCAEDVYKRKANDMAVAMPVVTYAFENRNAEMDIKSGWLKGDIYGLKLVSWVQDNKEKGLPMLTGTIMIIDEKTGFPVGFLDGTYITAARTGAAAAIGAKYLARPESETLLIVGTGLVAPFAVKAALTALPNLKKVLICNINHPENAEKMKQKLVRSDINADLCVVRNLKEAVAESDIIITATPSREPLIDSSWVRPGTHFSCVGSDMSGKEELDPKILKNARILTDDLKACIELGEIEIPLKSHIIYEEDIAGEIGRVITKQIPGRISGDQITVFDTTGIGLMDLSVGKYALDKASETDTGTSVEL